MGDYDTALGDTVFRSVDFDQNGNFVVGGYTTSPNIYASASVTDAYPVVVFYESDSTMRWYKTVTYTGITNLKVA